MEWFQDPSLARWVQTRGMSVGGIPLGFESYLKVLHPIPALRPSQSPDEYESAWWSWAHAARQAGVGSVAASSDWDSLFSDAGLPGRLGEWRVGEPTLGLLEPWILSEMTQAIRGFATPDEQAVVAVWAGRGFAQLAGTDAAHPTSRVALDERFIQLDRARSVTRDPELGLASSGPSSLLTGHLFTTGWRDYVLGSTTMTALSSADWPAQSGLGWTASRDGLMPQLYWSTDHTWAIGTEIDANFTLVGGAAELIRELHAIETIESFVISDPDDPLLTAW